MTIHVQPCDPSDAEAAVAVARSAIEATTGREYTAEQVAVWLRGITVARLRSMFAESSVFGAFETERLLGFATFLPADGRLDFLYVEPAAWRRGVARRLVAAVEHFARENGRRCIRVDASRLARPALRRLGYTEVAANPKTVGNVTFDNMWLEKSL